MFLSENILVRSYEVALVFRDDELERVLTAGRHSLWMWRRRVELHSMREAQLHHDDLDVIVRSGKIGDELLQVVDLADHQRALVWIDRRFFTVLGPGLHALWRTYHEVAVEVVDGRTIHFAHDRLTAILPRASRWLQQLLVPDGHAGLVYVDGALGPVLAAGTHAFWTGLKPVRTALVDLREQAVDVSGQEIMTSDKVTLRMNALVTYRVRDARAAVSEVSDYTTAIYREAQLALRAVVGTRELDTLLSEKDAVTDELQRALRDRATAMGLQVLAFGLRDIILPGDMKEILNRVTEARKAAEAAVITRREETAAMRSQANTAKLLASNPTLMKLKELEVLEKVVSGANLSLIVGSEGIGEKLMKLL